jgi:hypothetical protein
MSSIDSAAHSSTGRVLKEKIKLTRPILPSDSLHSQTSETPFCGGNSGHPNVNKSMCSADPFVYSFHVGISAEWRRNVLNINWNWDEYFLCASPETAAGGRVWLRPLHAKLADCVAVCYDNANKWKQRQLSFGCRLQNGTSCSADQDADGSTEAHLSRYFPIGRDLHRLTFGTLLKQSDSHTNERISDSRRPRGTN